MTASPTAVMTVHQIVVGVVEDVPTMNAGRYPFTYAYDFFRAHADKFGVDRGEWTSSRAEASQKVKEYAAATGQNLADVLVALAEGYIEEHHERATHFEKVDALIVQIQKAWKVFGYEEKPDEAEARIKANELRMTYSEAKHLAKVRFEMAELAAMSDADEN